MVLLVKESKTIFSILYYFFLYFCILYYTDLPLIKNQLSYLLHSKNK